MTNKIKCCKQYSKDSQYQIYNVCIGCGRLTQK